MVDYSENGRFEMDRQIMVEQHLKKKGITSTEVLEAMTQIPREIFVPEKYKHQSYHDGPLPIGMGQTISQPYIVALMTQLLKPDKNAKVLEIGTGCGYQTAILSKLFKVVYTIERLHELTETAMANLDRLNIKNVNFQTGDGTRGWHENIKFERQIITAAAPHFPDKLYQQLADPAIAVAPVGGQYSQELFVFEKQNDNFTKKQYCQCRFVRLIGKDGFDK